MTQDLLVLYREDAVPIHPEQTQRVSAGGGLGGKLTDAGALVFKTGLLPAEPATAARLTRERAS